MAKTITLSIEEKIVLHLKENGQKMSWLADKLEVTPGHLHSVLKGEGINKRDLSEDNRIKINKFLGTDY